MPKRSNDFQKIVYLVRTNLADGAIVTESKMLPSRLTGRNREVDVCVEGTVGGHPVIVCVECRDHIRPADVVWVEQMKAKHEQLVTNALILASRSGFTEGATELAEKYGVKIISLQDVDDADFGALLNETSSLWTKSASITAERVTVGVCATQDLAAESVRAMPDNLVYAANGAEIGPLSSVIGPIMESSRVRDYLLSNAAQEHKWFELYWKFPDDGESSCLFLKKLQPEVLRQIDFVRIQGPCKFEISEFGLRHGTLGEVRLAWGKTRVAGQDALVVATKDDEGLVKLSVSVEPGNE